MVTISRNWEEPVTSEVIAKAESVSKKYLDGILRTLRGAGLLRAIKGQGGGYMLASPPWEISARDVVQVLERGLAVVPCVDDPSECSKAGTCPVREVWRSLSAGVSDTLGKVTLAALVAWEPGMEPKNTGYYI
jgi:Rrf2 family protein